MGRSSIISTVVIIAGALLLVSHLLAPRIQSFVTYGATWPTTRIPVRYCINTANPQRFDNGQELISDAEFITLVRAAFQKWEDVSGAYIAFRYDGTCSSDPTDLFDGVTVVGWGTPDPGATGQATIRAQGSGILEGGIVLCSSRCNPHYDDNAAIYKQIFRERLFPDLVLHEAGHLLGLGHSDDPCSVMAVSSPCRGSAVLQADDIQGVQALYPEPTSPTPTPTLTPTAAPTPTPTPTPTPLPALIIEQQLAGIAGKYDFVFGWQEGSQSWTWYIAGASGNTLQGLQTGRGYFIFMKQAATLAYGGRSWALAAGWNLIGFY